MAEHTDDRYGFYLSSIGTSFDASVFTNSALETGRWYHMCGTSDGTVKLYLDGVQQSATSTLSGGIKDDVDSSVFIGKFGRSDSEFNGSIDEVMIFNRSLSSDEIKSLYDASSDEYDYPFSALRLGSHSVEG